MDSEFEKSLTRQPVKQIPPHWRAEILATARNAGSSRHSSLITRSPLSTINHKLSTLFWPHPAAWAGLAAVWIFTAVINFSMRDQPAPVAKEAPPSTEVLVQLRQQQKLYAELVGMHETQEADRPRVFVPKPRSDRNTTLPA